MRAPIFALCLAAAAVFVAPHAAHAADAPDVVKLKDGSMYRGTIAELVAGDHVVLVLATGETKRFEMKDVEQAGPSAAPPAQPVAPPPPPPPGGAPAALQLAANEKDVTFSIKTGQAAVVGTAFVGGQAGVVAGVADAYSTLCVAPCATGLPVGTHHMGLSLGDGAVVPADAPVSITGPGKLDGTYTSHRATRITGALIWLGSLGGGIGLAIAARNADHECLPPAAPGFAPVCMDKADTTMMGEALGIVVGGSLIGAILMFVRDNATIEFTPAGALVAPKEGVAVDGRGLVVRF